MDEGVTEYITGRADDTDAALLLLREVEDTIPEGPGGLLLQLRLQCIPRLGRRAPRWGGVGFLLGLDSNERGAKNIDSKY